MRHLNLIFMSLLTVSLHSPLAHAQLLKSTTIKPALNTVTTEQKIIETQLLDSTKLTVQEQTAVEKVIEPIPLNTDVKTIDTDIKLTSSLPENQIQQNTAVEYKPAPTLQTDATKPLVEYQAKTLQQAVDSNTLNTDVKVLDGTPSLDNPLTDKLSELKTNTLQQTVDSNTLNTNIKVLDGAPSLDSPLTDKLSELKTNTLQQTVDSNTLDTNIKVLDGAPALDSITKDAVLKYQDQDSLNVLEATPKILNTDYTDKIDALSPLQKPYDALGPLNILNPEALPQVEKDPKQTTTATASCETTDNVCVINQEGNVVCAFDKGTTLYKTFDYKHDAVDLSASPNLPHLYIATSNNDVYLEDDEDDSSTPVVSAKDIDTEHKIIALHAFDDGLLILTEKNDASVINIYFYNDTTKAIRVIQDYYDNGGIDIASNTSNWERAYALLHRDGSVRLYIADENRTIPSGSKSPVYFDAIQNGNGFHTIDLKNNQLIGSSRSGSDTIGELGVLVDVATDAQSSNVFLASDTTVTKIPTVDGAPYQYDDAGLETFSVLDVTDIQQLEIAHLCVIEDIPAEETPTEETTPEETEEAAAEEEAHCTEYAYSGLNIVWNEETGQCECVDYEYTITNEDGSITCSNDSEETFVPEVSDQVSDTIIEENTQVTPTPWSGMVSGGCSGSSLVGFGPQHSMISLWQCFIIGFGPMATMIACRIRKNRNK